MFLNHTGKLIINIMKNLFILLLLLSCTASAQDIDIYCAGLTNDNTRVEIKLQVDTNEKTITIDDSATYKFLVSNKFNYVWENFVGNTAYTNILNKLDGSMVVLTPNQTPNQPPIVRAQLICVEEKDIKFE
tara:strand:- start:57 stop:449 length:393 start_codon:yes stop_codon:yes gene_type:complete